MACKRQCDWLVAGSAAAQNDRPCCALAILCREVIGDGVEVSVCLGLQQVQQQLTAAGQDTRWLDPRTLGDDGSPEGEFGSG